MGLATSAQAQFPGQGGVSPALQALGSFLSVGGYFYTSSATRSAAGASKFYSEASFFDPPAKLFGFEVAGGFQLVSADDHFLPFAGGYGLSMYGAAVRFSTPSIGHRLVLSLTAGMYGTQFSTKTGINATVFSPSVALEVSYPLVKFVTLTAGYRVAPTIDHLNTDGFIVGVKLF